MSDTCCTYTVAGITINASSGDTLNTDFEEGVISGLDGAPIRKQIDPRGQTDGGIVHPAFFGPRVITFAGKVLIRSNNDPGSTLWNTAVNNLELSVVTALESFLNSTTTLSWTPTGGSPRSLTVTYGTEGGEIQFSGNMLDRNFTFTLVAENPTIS
jgi:hypothetical protein